MICLDNKVVEWISFTSTKRDRVKHFRKESTQKFYVSIEDSSNLDSNAIQNKSKQMLSASGVSTTLKITFKFFI